MKNVIFTLGSNFVTMAVSAIITFFAPRHLSVTEFSWFQLYLFYTGYVAIFTLGWGEGVYLRYGGKHYSELNKSRFAGQFIVYTVFEFIISLAIIAASCVFNGVYARIAVSIGIVVFIYAPCLFFRNLLICVNRAKEYATSHILERSIYCLAVIMSLFVFGSGYTGLILADFSGKFCAALYLIYVCRGLVFCKAEGIGDIAQEANRNILVGFKLILSNLVGLLIVGIVRFGIERNWDTETFGRVSLTISISNLLMVFIRAVSLVMFPMLRRTNSNKLAGIYNIMRTCLMILLLGMLMFYYPMKVFLSAWLPAYADSLKYMALLFPMCVFESKTSMLIETYMKTLRKEKTLLFVNVATVCLSLLLTGVTVYGMNNLDLAIVSIVVLLAFRCVLSEFLLSRTMDIQVKRDIVLELAMTVIFICASWFIGGLIGLSIYSVAYLVYLFVKRHDLVNLTEFVKKRVSTIN